MYPTIREVDLYTVDVVDLCSSVLGKHLLDLDKDSVNIGLWGEVDAVLGYLILRECGAELADLTTLLCQTRQEQGNTYEGIATVVALRLDYSTITLTTDNGAYFLHLSGNVDFAYCSSGVLAAMLLSNIAQGACRAEVRNSVTYGMTEHVVGY